jgi:hypothetical protein
VPSANAVVLSVIGLGAGAPAGGCCAETKTLPIVIPSTRAVVHRVLLITNLLL